ncbi:MAG: AEC family transporter [Rhodospirillaceae bacterium]|jgi:malate permease and related proteins|nr:AEC family transporter [Rhodospirillales bacterium]MBT3904281.1 AEC family transporter [Rhodospirillaceae bacterium]MBT4701085.1 AEC family transporter [Rhodospirillaceae bacterium]MBT5033154.1 AEC family transporter [Rhodospirillaceae bacterium]MBT6219252.1 AEC family transporter [Rhodospirillaceae bacterium]
MLLQLLEIVAPVFICTAIGYGWIKAGLPSDTTLASALVLNIGTPCLVFYTLTAINLDPAAFGEMAIAALAVLAGALAVSWAMLAMVRLPQRSFLPALILPNMGNMGLPLALFAFGEKGLALAIALFSIIAIAQFTLGLGIAAGSMTFKVAVRQPILYAVAVALVFMSGDMTPPKWILETTKLLGGITIPLLLITLGITLGQIKMGSLKRALPLSVFRLASGFVVGILVAELMGLEGMAKGVVILQSSMPVAVFSYLFAVTFKQDPEDVASLTMISTLLTFATLPALLWFVI